MAEAVLNGVLKFREGKKWKSRWCIIRKLSPVADRLHVYLYKENIDHARKHGAEKAVISLEGFYGIESGFVFDKEQHVMAIICQHQVVLLAFSHREMLIEWEIEIREQLGEEQQYPVGLVKCPAHSRVGVCSGRLHIQGQGICLTSGVPPRLLLSWKVPDIKKYGCVDQRFCIEGGRTCGKGAGLFAFETEQQQAIYERIHEIAKGRVTTGCGWTKSNRRSQTGTLSPHLSFAGSSPSHTINRASAAYSEVNFYEEVKECEQTVSVTDSSNDTTTTVVADSSTLPFQTQTLCSIENVSSTTSVCSAYTPQSHTSGSYSVRSRSSVSPEVDIANNSLRRCNKRHSLELDTVTVSPEHTSAMVGTARKVVKKNSKPNPFGLVIPPPSIKVSKTDRSNTLPRQHKFRQRSVCCEGTGRQGRNSKKRNSVDMLASLQSSSSASDVLQWVRRSSPQSIISSSSSSSSKDSMPSSGTSDENLDPATVTYAQLAGGASDVYESFGGISLGSQVETKKKPVYSLAHGMTESLCSRVLPGNMEIPPEHPSLAPTKPLAYMDLKRFDGRDYYTPQTQASHSDQSYFGEPTEESCIEYSSITGVVPAPQMAAPIRQLSLNVPVPMDEYASDYAALPLNRCQPFPASSNNRDSVSVAPAEVEQIYVPPAALQSGEYSLADPPPLPVRSSKSKGASADKTQLLKAVPPPYSVGVATQGQAQNQPSHINLLARVPPPGGPEVKHVHSNSAPESFTFTSQESDYMHMNHAAKAEEQAEPDSIFCMVKLPVRNRTNSYGSHSLNNDSRDSYMDMSFPQGCTHSLTRSWSMKESRRAMRSQMALSRSLENELEGLACGDNAQSQASRSDDYMPMMPASSQDNLHDPSQTKLVPFSDLIVHEHVPAKASGNGAAGHPPAEGPPPLPPPRKGSMDSNLNNTSSPKPGFLSRLMRRNSNKEKKNKYDDGGSERSYINHTIKPEVLQPPVNLAGVPTGSSVERTPPLSVRRKGSSDLLTIEEERDAVHTVVLTRSQTMPGPLCMTGYLTPQPPAKPHIAYSERSAKPPPVPPRTDSSGLLQTVPSTTEISSASESAKNDNYLEMGDLSQSSDGASSDTLDSDAGLKSKLDACVPPPVPDRASERRVPYRELVRDCRGANCTSLGAFQTQSIPANSNLVYADSNPNISTERAQRGATDKVLNDTYIQIREVIPALPEYTLSPPTSPKSLNTLLEETVPPPVPRRVDKQGAPVAAIESPYAGIRKKGRMPTPERCLQGPEMARKEYICGATEDTDRLPYSSIEKQPMQETSVVEMDEGEQQADLSRRGTLEMPGSKPLRHKPPNLTLPGVDAAAAAAEEAARRAEDEDAGVFTDDEDTDEDSVWITQTPGSQKVSSPTEDKRGSLRSRSTNTSSTVSQNSHKSSDTERVRSSDEHKSSPASTTLRPRSGKEYHKLDRRKLAEIFGDAESEAPQSPKVFTFDNVNDQLSVASGNNSLHSSGTNSPRSPAMQKLQVLENPYVNISLPVDRADVGVSISETPPASPYSAISNTSGSSSPLLHYAEIDLTHSMRRKSKPTRTRRIKSDTEYAMIDMLATTAASRVGKEHAQLREDTLRRKDEKSAAREEAAKEGGRSKDRKSSAPTQVSKRLSSASFSTKDRKHSAS